MKKEFWLDRWEREEIGFHQTEINHYLRKYWQELHLAHGSTVFVPLCGKSRDMMWLHQQGHPVLGVELSEIATQAFFAENSLVPHRVAGKKFDRYEADGIRLLCGDFFELRQDDLADVSAVYDRASLIALPPDMRERYVRHLMGILPAATKILLITLDYPQTEMQGPPFAVPSDEVEALYSQRAKVRLLEQTDVLAQNPRFQERGVTRLQQNAFLLTRARNSQPSK